MAFHLIVTCVSQKTEKQSLSILDPSLKKGSVDTVYTQWENALQKSALKKKRAIDLYNGGLWGSYKDSWGIVNGRVKNANLWILSAGYGLINSNEEIKPYNITFQDPRDDVPSILAKIEPQSENEAKKDISQAWWQKLAEQNSITKLLSSFGKEDFALFVLGKDYLDAVYEDLASGISSSPCPSNIAVISNNENDPTAKKLEPNWLYANKRLVNLPGSNATFVNAKIAHRLLLEMFEKKDGLSWWSLRNFNDYLKATSNHLALPKQHKRTPGTDDEIKAYIEDALRCNDTPFSRLHRRYRDDGKACEYSRFKGLYTEVREKLKNNAYISRPDFPVRHKARKSKMLYFLPDWDDRVDPLYDFDLDMPFKDRDPYRHDTYHYELFGHLNCDGILVSKSVLEDNKDKLQRIREKGIHKYLRVPNNVPVLADCGAFNYITEHDPPFETRETLDFYQDLGFDYGVAIDHLIVPGILKRSKYYKYESNRWAEIDSNSYNSLKKLETVKILKNRTKPLQSDLYRTSTLICEEVYLDEQERQRRYNLTISNAKDFIEGHKASEYTFIPIGSAQGWDPESYAYAVKLYQDMGYGYIALGGLVRSTTPEIISILKAVKKIKKPSTRLHVFGVARLDAIEAFLAHGVTSVDSAGALRQAWLSSSGNYHWPDGNHYTAIRIPPADKGAKVKKILEQGHVSHEELLQMELECRQVLRSYDQGKIDVTEVMKIVMSYHLIMGGDPNFEQKYLRTLQDKPWKSCDCIICKNAGIEVVIFRRNNRNRRRGFHNTWVFYNKFKELTCRE